MTVVPVYNVVVVPDSNIYFGIDNYKNFIRSVCPASSLRSMPAVIL